MAITRYCRIPPLALLLASSPGSPLARAHMTFAPEQNLRRGRAWGPLSYFTTGSKVVRCTLAGESLGTRLLCCHTIQKSTCGLCALGGGHRLSINGVLPSGPTEPPTLYRIDVLGGKNISVHTSTDPRHVS